MSAPNLNVYSNYSDKVPGKWMLSVDAASGKRDIHSEGIACAAHVYPVDISSSFRASVEATFQNLAENVEVVDNPPPASTLGAAGYAGVIRVKLDSMRPRLEFIQGFWSAKARSDMEIDAGLVVDGPSGRLLGTQASGRGTDEESGDCPTGAGVIGHASEEAMKSLLGALGERFGNAPQLRGQKP